MGFCNFPSIREPLGLIQGEMALLNKLCISSNIDGIPELYPPSTNELLINMNKIKNDAKASKKNQNYQLINQINKFDFDYYPDIEDCSNKLIRLINNPKLCKSLLRKHQSYIKSNFSIEKHLFNLDNIINNYFIN